MVKTINQHYGQDFQPGGWCCHKMLPCGFVQKIWPFYMAELIFSTISLCVFLIIVSNSKTYMGTIWLFNSSPWKDPPFLSSVNHLFRLGPSIPWRTVSHNQRVNTFNIIGWQYPNWESESQLNWSTRLFIILGVTTFIRTFVPAEFLWKWYCQFNSSQSTNPTWNCPFTLW